MKVKSALFFFITIITFVFNYSKSDETYTIEMKDGVKYVHNHAPLWGDTTKVALEFVQKIGELETEDENYQLYYPRDEAKDSAGNIYVLDGGNYRVQKFNPHGKYLATIGRKGQGPSELERTLTLDIDINGNILVNDNRIIKIFTQNGKEFKRIQLIPLKTPANSRLTNSGKFVTQKMGFIGLGTEKIALINVFDADGNHITGFCDPVDYKNVVANENENRLDFALDIQDNIYVSFGYQNRIEKFSLEGEMIYKMDRILKFKPVSAKAEPGGRMQEQMGSRISGDLGIDAKNRIWIITHTNKDELEFEIFNEDGILLGYVTWIGLPNMTRMRIIGNYVYFFETQEEMCVYEYKIVEN